MANEMLRIMWFVPPAVAVAASWLERPGFKLDASRTLSSDEQFEALVSERADAAVTAMDNVLDWNQRPGPKDFVIVAQLEATTPLNLVGVDRIKELKDLSGANILVDAPHNGFVIALLAMLNSVGLTTADYQLTPVGGVKERFDALLAGQGDATLLGAPFDSLAMAKGLSRIASVQELYPDFPGQGLVVRKSTISNKVALHAWIEDLKFVLDKIPDNIDKLRMSLAGLDISHVAIESMLAALPVTLIPEVSGINLLLSHRAQLGLVGATESYEQIVDLGLVQ